MSDEDDLPVLTQVLVTASGRAPATGKGSVAEPAADGRVEPALQRLLVIGSDPDDDAASFTSTPASTDAVADPRRPTLRDVFSPTVPNGDDHLADGSSRGGPPREGGAFADLQHPWDLDEPHIDRHAIGRAAPTERGADDGMHGLDAFGTTPLRAAPPLAGRPSPSPSDPEGATAIAVRDDVLDRLAARIDTELDARIAQTIRVELDAAIAHLQARLRVELSEALRDVVGHAVEEAIVHRMRTGGDVGPGFR